MVIVSARQSHGSLGLRRRGRMYPHRRPLLIIWRDDEGGESVIGHGPGEVVWLVVACCLLWCAPASPMLIQSLATYVASTKNVQVSWSVTCIQVNLYTSYNLIELYVFIQLELVPYEFNQFLCMDLQLDTTRSSRTFLYISKTCQKLVSCLQLTTEDVRKMYGRCT